jgi:hypothetical protein
MLIWLLGAVFPNTDEGTMLGIANAPAVNNDDLRKKSLLLVFNFSFILLFSIFVGIFSFRILATTDELRLRALLCLRDEWQLSYTSKVLCRMDKCLF